MSAPIKMVLDLDTGIDDALALAYALGSPEVELAAVVCSYGNVAVDTATRNTLALLRMLGHPEVPVYRGVDRALGAKGEFRPPAGVVRIHGENGLGGQELSGWCYAAPRSGVDYLAQVFDEADEGLRYVPTGPLTNLALALRATSADARALPRVTFMGGALTVPGNVTPCAEANIHAPNEHLACDAFIEMIRINCAVMDELSRY